ncbi:protease modulator HflK [Sphingomonas sp.]|jgi:membrane protease subunit HflK|uniref:protease modulator HflK n=1 Tax=Sphingomonas sp. TaxID=28214 RepID=UPI002D7E39BF|nr:protease modulator HflK [Sphingomonas sp.]HEU0045193.1 protease modulator HflK [Sphingomonas sp.]
MNFLQRLFARPRIFSIDTPKGPWGGGGDGGEGGGGGGPRNPWSVPPGGRKPPQRPTALDEFLRKARTAGGGGGGGNPFTGLPGGPNAKSLWLIGAGILLMIWLIFTSFHNIAPQQRAVVTYFGRYGGTLEPGIQLTAPAPFASVQKVDVSAIREEVFPEGGGENLVLTRDRNVVDLAYQVRWTIANPEDYIFQLAEPQATVRATAESAVREAVANVTLDEAIGPGRAGVESQVQIRMQQILDEYNSGIRIQGVAIRQADPPEAVNDAFKGVTAAQQYVSTLRNQAQAYAQQKLALAQGEAASFNAYYEQYSLAPEVTRRRMYYETMEAVLAKTDKTIVETPGVTPYLPLDRNRRLVEPSVQTAQPAPQAGAAQ